MANATGEATGTPGMTNGCVENNGVEIRPMFADPPAVSDQQSGGHNPTQVTTNELLCFVSNKMDIMTEELLVKLCADFYGKHVIEAAKRLLFDLCRSVRVDIDLPRQVRRQGPKKKNADLIDTIRLCHEMGSDLPVFVARDLASLPPISADCFDVSSLLRDMENIKLELRALGDMSKIAADLSSAVNTMKEMTHVMHVNTTIHPPGVTDTTPPTESLSSTADANRMSPCDISVGLTDDGPMLVGNDSRPTTRDSTSTEPSCTRVAETIEDLTVETTSDNDASLHCLPDAATNNETTMASTSQTPARVVKTRRNGEPNDKPVTTRTLAQVVSTMRDDATESDGFERVTRRRTRDDRPRADKDKPAHIIGSRPADAGNGLCAAVRHGHGGNRSGGLFVSRLSPNTSASTVRRHIKDSCGVDVKCMSIKTKYDSYCSFRVDCDESCMKRLLQPSMWPVGILVRSFV